MLIHITIPITLHDNLLTFRGSGKVFELKGKLLKIITNKNYNVDLASLSDKKLLYDFAREMNFDIKAQGIKSLRDRSFKKILKLPGLMYSASGFPNTIFFSSNGDEFFDSSKLSLQEKHAGNFSNIIDDEIVAIADNLLENKNLSKKQHEQILIKCILLHEIV